MPEANGDPAVAPGGYPCGMIPSPPDERDWRYPAVGVMRAPEDRPEDYLGSLWPAVRNQGSTYSCVSHAGEMHTSLREEPELGRLAPFSVQFGYSHRPNQFYYQGKGMIPREYFATQRKHGIPPERFWPGIVEVGKETRPEPFDTVLEAALPHRIDGYAAVDMKCIGEAKSAIMERRGVLIGIPVHKNFIPDSDGVIPMPKGGLRGPHMMLAIYWLKDLWIVPNSWGPEWGGIALPDRTRRAGYCYVPWSYPILEAWTTVDAPTQRVREVLIIEGEPIMWVNGQPTEPKDVAPSIVNDRFSLAIRHVAEALGVEVTGFGKYDEGPHAGRMWAMFKLVQKPWG